VIELKLVKLGLTRDVRDLPFSDLQYFEPRNSLNDSIDNILRRLGR
jgi:hypothetical protein